MKIAPSNDLPTICSVCRQSPAAHNPKITYVNMDSAYDGPVVKEDSLGNPIVPEGEPGVYVEAIVICEHCVIESARLLGYDKVDELQDDLAEMDAYIGHLEAEIKEKDKSISDLSHTVGTLIDTPVKRPPGRPVLRGPDSHEDQIKDMRSKEAQKGRLSKAIGKG